ncbi:MAG: hypothetical protein OQJ81_12760 [Melioribacteraceae bacterium]|nr:hypothetical protein [Melioribacteraceae bacterium]
MKSKLVFNSKLNRIISFLSFIILLLLFESCSSLSTLDGTIEQQIIFKSEELKSKLNDNRGGLNIPQNSRIVDYKIEKDENRLIINFNKNLSYMAFREDNVKDLYYYVKEYYGKSIEGYSLSITTLDLPIEELIPNYYRTITEIDSTRIFKLSNKNQIPVVSKISRPFNITNGLSNNNIALWHSHGYYYNHKLDRWMFQRARLFQTIEDLGPMAFTLPYLIPMLENAGCNVFVPRERDTQINEVIVDDELLDGSINIVENSNVKWKKSKNKGFSLSEYPLRSNVNPFEQGGYSFIESSRENISSFSYIPSIPEKGDYAVYISYKTLENSTSNAEYTVYHLGGETKFRVNQKIGGSTWIYLGTFSFGEGRNETKASLRISNYSENEGEIITTDAVRFGGGLGLVERNGKVSGKPKFMEAARYWMQFAGVNDSLVFNINGDTLDYNDDYQSRGEWVNYLVGSPFGPNKDRNISGLGIPIDLSIAMHTDAGISNSDTTIGTLAIYSSTDLDSNITFPNGVSRLANRDFTDMVQTQLVEDLRNKYDPIWRRREIRDARYSEATRPNVPSILLELLSHQNFLDNIFQLDPRYRFDVSRSIYKASLKFIHSQNGSDFVVQPLPPNHFSTSITAEDEILLKWKPQIDPIEPTANPNGYVVYSKIGEGGFDNGRFTADTNFVFRNAEIGKIYSFKVTAVNNGGESFPSEILSTCNFGQDSKQVLIVNGFDRICGPEIINEPNFKGFLSTLDAGVPDKYDIGFTGLQHNFDPNIRWGTDDMPGHGASYADYESKIIAGNTFDYPYLHGKSITAAGYSFVSASDEAISSGLVDLESYKFVDFIMGEEKETSWPKSYTDSLLGKQFRVYPDELKIKIQNYLNSGGNIFISGSYIGSDLFLNKTENDTEFGKNALKYKLNTDHAVRIGEVYSLNKTIFPNNEVIKFNTELNSEIYAVEAPDAIGPINGSVSILRYKENDTSAGILYKKEYGIIALGFPFETILDENVRNILMKNILTYFFSK